jgi:uncharacterized membrane protein YvlD (DUF360 family)
MPIKLTRPSLIALAVGALYLLLMAGLFPRRELADHDFATAALIGAVCAATVEALLHRWRRTAAAPSASPAAPAVEPPSVP